MREKYPERQRGTDTPTVGDRLRRYQREGGANKSQKSKLGSRWRQPQGKENRRRTARESGPRDAARLLARPSSTWDPRPHLRHGSRSRLAAGPGLDCSGHVSLRAARLSQLEPFFPGPGGPCEPRLGRPVLARPPGSTISSHTRHPNTAALASSPLPGQGGPLLRSFFNPPPSVSLRVFNLYLFLFRIPK